MGLSRIDRVRNEEVRRRPRIERELESRVDQRVFRWFGHVERMDEYSMASRAFRDNAREKDRKEWRALVHM